MNDVIKNLQEANKQYQNASQDKVLSQILRQNFESDKVKIINSRLPINVEIDVIKPTDLKKHQWYVKKYRQYLYDKHSDIQLSHNDLPDILRTQYFKFHSQTALNSNYGTFLLHQKQDALLNNVFPEIDEKHSCLYNGLLTFSKNFLLKNYVVNQDAKISDIIFKTLCDNNHLNPDDWVFQSSLHKNTSMFHVHFRMYQKKNSDTPYRTNNFSAKDTKDIRLNIRDYFKKISKRNNKTNKKNFKIQQLYIKHQQKTSQLINLTNNMLDIALSNEYTFNDIFKRFCLDLANMQPQHKIQYKEYQKAVTQRVQSALSKYDYYLKNEYKDGNINEEQYENNLLKYREELVKFAKNEIRNWTIQWEIEITAKLSTIFNASHLNDILKDYESALNKEQDFHLFTDKMKQMSFLDFCDIPNFLRKKQYKAPLFLTSLWALENLIMNDTNLYKQLEMKTDNMIDLSSVVRYNQELSKRREMDFKMAHKTLRRTLTNNGK